MSLAARQIGIDTNMCINEGSRSSPENVPGDTTVVEIQQSIDESECQESASALMGANQEYQSQIRDWLIKSRQHKKEVPDSCLADTDSRTIPPLVPAPAQLGSALSNGNGSNDSSQSRRNIFAKNLRSSFRSFRRKSDPEAVSGQEGDSGQGLANELQKQSSVRVDAWRRVQGMVGYGNSAGRSTGGSEGGFAVRKTRLRGRPLSKALREVQRQRDIVTVKDAEQATAAWRGSGHEEVERSFGDVAAIVSKARNYSGPKTLRTDSQEESLNHWFNMTVPYLKVAGFVLLATFDLILALVFHVFWSQKDFMCEEGTGLAAEPRLVQVVMLSAVAGLHFIRTASKVLKTDGGGEMVGLRYFYSKELFGYFGVWVNNVDFFLNAASCTVLALHALDCGGADQRYSIIVRRIHSHFHIIRSLFAFQRCFSMNEYLRQQLQIAVSVNKRRFISAETKINLDLTYICDRLIAMAIPCVDKMYRNDIRDVARFFAVFHYGTFLVYSLCEGHEEGGNGNYDTSLLYNQVQHITFHDHNVPRFRCIVKFCETSTDWLDAGDKNVVAVHCQGGKGRTGTFCAALMLYSGFCDTAQEALDKFALRRTQRMRGGESLQGVSSPAQIRYVHYLEAYVYEGVDYQVCNYRILHEVSLANMQPGCMLNSSITFIVEVDGVMHYDHGKEAGILSWEACDKCGFTFPCGDVVVAGDVTVRFFVFDEAESWDFVANHRSTRGKLGEGARSIKYAGLTGKQLFFVSFHTAFHRGNITLCKNEVDGAYNAPKDKFSEDFNVTMHLRDFNGLGHEEPSAAANAMDTASHLGTVRLKGLDEFMPRKINSALQFLNTGDLVKKVFEKACPEALTFAVGDKVVDQECSGHIMLHYVTRGVTSTTPKSAFVTLKSIKAVFEGEVHGVGDILQRGMDKFLVGRAPDYYAGGDGCQTRRIRLPLSPDGYLPIEAPGLDQQELACLYSYLAHQVSGRSRRYRDKISSLNNRNATLRTTQMIESRGNKKVLGQLIQRFGIADTEALFCGSNAQYDKGLGRFEGGKAYVVSNWVLFSSERSVFNPTKRSEIVIRIHDILSIAPKGDKLVMQMDGEHEREAARPSVHQRRPSYSDSEHSDGHLVAGGQKRGMAWMRRPKKRGHLELMQQRLQGGVATLRFPDEETCEAFTRAIQERMRELQNTHSKQQSWDMSALKFGYILPAERDDQGGQDFLQHLLNISEVRCYAAGEEIIAKDDSHRSLYHVISGTAVRYSNSNLNMEDIGPGEIMGEWRFLAYNTGFAETSQVVATTEVKCFVSPFEQVQTLCSLRKEFAVRFYRGLALSCIIRSRQFRRLYQQNLQRWGEKTEKEAVVRLSPRRNREAQQHPSATQPNGGRTFLAPRYHRSTTNLFGRNAGAGKGTYQTRMESPL